jgi:hypothetical protein
MGRISIVLVAVSLVGAGLVACSGKSSLHPGSDLAGPPSVDADGQADGGNDSEVLGSVGGSSEVGEAVAMFNGVVVATLGQGATSTPTYAVLADFASGPNVDLSPAAAGCSCAQAAVVVGLPPFSPGPGSAGPVTLSSTGGGSPLATLTPGSGGGGIEASIRGNDGSWGLSSALESWDLGALPAGSYADVPSLPWNPGDDLLVVAAGDAVHAFSGTLQVPALLSGVTPVLGEAPLVIDRTQDFSITWTPEWRANESMLLILRQWTQPATICYCTAPDAAATLTVGASLLSQFSTQQGQLSLERLITSTASSDNATITLIGEVAETAGVVFQ